VGLVLPVVVVTVVVLAAMAVVKAAGRLWEMAWVTAVTMSGTEMAGVVAVLLVA